MSATNADASSLSEKMIIFRGLLKEGEQKALDGMLNSFLAQVEDVPNAPPERVARGERLVAFPVGVNGPAAAKQLIKKTKEQRLALGGSMGITPTISPTITTITITTTIASHPIITCNIAAAPKRP